MIVRMDGTPQIASQITRPIEMGDDTVQIAPDAAVHAIVNATVRMRTLDQLGKGEHATVTGINASAAFGTLDALVTRRLWELGFLPGAQISVVGFGLLKRDPIAVKIGGTKFALRRAEAQKIVVKDKSVVELAQ